jgi:predicted nucleotidyltransferase
MTVVRTAGAIPGLPDAASERLLGVFTAAPAVEEVWLYGSRAMGRHRPSSDIDLTLKGRLLQHGDLLRLMDAIEELLLPWQVDLSLYPTLPPDLQAHVDRVGLRLLLPGREA